MREILFRGKRLDNGEWVEGFYCKHNMVQVCFSSDDPKTKHLIIQDGFCDWGFEPPLCGIEIDPETVGQFTGVIDKNDRKIFEGDVVCVVCRGIDEEDGNAVIVWDKETSRFIIEWKSIVSDFDSVYGHECEVIGNIHDNPELLEGGA